MNQKQPRLIVTEVDDFGGGSELSVLRERTSVNTDGPTPTDQTALLVPPPTSLGSSGKIGRSFRSSFDDDMSDLSYLSQISSHMRKRHHSTHSGITSLHPRSSIAQPLLHASDYLGEASMLSCVMSLTNTVLGAGILALPYAVSTMGLIMGMTMIIISALVMGTGSFLAMLSSKTFANGTTFSDLGWKILPSKVMQLCDLCNAIGNFGTLCAYLIIIGDTAPHAMKHLIGKDGDHPFYLDRKFVIFVYSLLLLFPAMRHRSFDNIWLASAFAMFCFLFIFALALSYRLDPSLRNKVRNYIRDEHSSNDNSDSDSESEVDWGWNLWPHCSAIQFLRVMPIILLAMANTQNAIVLSHELKNNSVQRLMMLLCYTFAICLTFYLLIVWAIYTTIGNELDSDFFLNYPTDSWDFTVARLLFSIAVCLSYPLVLNPVRESVAFLTIQRSCLHPRTSDVQFYCLSYGVFLVSFLVAMLTDNLGLVIGVTSSFASGASSFILPGLAFYKRCTPNGGPFMYSPFGTAAFQNDPQMQHNHRMITQKNEQQSGGDRHSTNADDHRALVIAGGTPIREIRIPSVIIHSKDMWNVWPKCMTYLALTLTATGFVIVPVLLTSQFL